MKKQTDSLRIWLEQNYNIPNIQYQDLEPGNRIIQFTFQPKEKEKASFTITVLEQQVITAPDSVKTFINTTSNDDNTIVKIIVKKP